MCSIRTGIHVANISVGHVEDACRTRTFLSLHTARPTMVSMTPHNFMIFSTVSFIAPELSVSRATGPSTIKTSILLLHNDVFT